MSIYLNNNRINTIVLIINTETEKEPTHISAVTSDIEWNDEWEARGLSGTVFDIVVGDDISPCLSVSLVVTNANLNTPATIYWGDGETTTLPKTGAQTRQYHAYPTAGHYELRVDNKTSGVYFQNSLPKVDSIYTYIINLTVKSVRRLKQIGSNITNALYMCYNCYWCNSDEGGYPDYLPPIPPNVTSLYCTFYNLFKYRKDKIPRIDHLSKCDSFYATFAGFHEAKFDVLKFPSSARNIGKTYYECYQIDYIPYDVFENCGNTTGIGPVFYNCFEVKGEYPIISNLTAAITLDSLFQNCYEIGENGCIPELPYAPNCTNINYMFCNNYRPRADHDMRIAEHLPKVNSMNMTFYNCSMLNCKAEVPPTISANNGLYLTYCNCVSLSGEFPDLPTEYKYSMLQTFENCLQLSGQIKPFPNGVINILLTYKNCYNATGKCPNLNNLGIPNSTESYKSTFLGCEKLTEGPDLFIDADKANASTAKATSFLNMFAYCFALSSFNCDLSPYTKIINTGYMFAENMDLLHHTMAFPPNVTNADSMFYKCYRLDENVPQWPTKLASAKNIYAYDFLIKPMLDADGNVETDTTKLDKAGSTSSTFLNALYSTSGATMKLFYDACGTKYGVINADWSF